MHGAAIFDQYESKVRSYCRSFPTVFSKAKGAIITAADGREYIDFFNGAGALNYGHNPDAIKQQLVDYLLGDNIIHGLDMMTTAKAQLIETFETQLLAPKGLDYKIMFPGPTGTNAVEAALKLARKYTGRRTVWAFMGAFHGMTLGSLALTTERAARKGGGVPLNDVTHIPAPYMFPELDTIEYMETLISDDHSGIEKPAALILETVQAEGGVYVLDSEYLRALRDFCTKHEILLIIDDIQVGCARTGSFFSFERASIAPDMVCLSKSIGGYGLPFALMLMRPEIDVFDPGEHNGTFRGNQLAIVAARAAVEYMQATGVEKMASERGEIIGNYLHQRLDKYGLPVRGIGCIWGIDMGSDAASKAVMNASFAHGVIHERAGRDNSVVKLMPSLVIEEELLRKGLAIVCDQIEQVVAKG